MRPRHPSAPGPFRTRGEGWGRGALHDDEGFGPGGFTLIELLVVLAMLAIAAAVSVPALRPPAERSAGAAADSLLHVLARARADAATRGAPVHVAVRVGDGGFSVVADADGGGDTLRAGSLPLPAGGRVIGGRGDAARVSFDAAGRARADRVAVTDEDGRIEIVVDPWSGGARAAR